MMHQGSEQQSEPDRAHWFSEAGAKQAAADMQSGELDGWKYRASYSPRYLHWVVTAYDSDGYEVGVW